MNETNYIETNMVAYCIGNPDDLSLATNFYKETLDELKISSNRKWYFSDSAGAIRSKGVWHFWVEERLSNGNLEGRIYKVSSVYDLLKLACENVSDLDASKKMQFVRNVVMNEWPG